MAIGPLLSVIAQSSYVAFSIPAAYITTVSVISVTVRPASCKNCIVVRYSRYSTYPSMDAFCYWYMYWYRYFTPNHPQLNTIFVQL